MKLKEEIISLLKQCYDPEIPIDLWNLGLIYSIDLKPDKKKNFNVCITMSLTTPGCSMGQQMADDIKSKVSKIKEVNDVIVSVTFEPPWQPEMMTDIAKQKLGFDNKVQKTNQEKIETTWE